MLSIRIVTNDGYLLITQDGYESDYMTPEEVARFTLNDLNHQIVRDAWGIPDGVHLSRVIDLLGKGGNVSDIREMKHIWRA